MGTILTNVYIGKMILLIDKNGICEIKSTSPRTRMPMCIIISVKTYYDTQKKMPFGELYIYILDI